MSPFIIMALSSLFVGVRSRSLLGRIPESPEAEQCDQLTAPWRDTQLSSLSGDWSYMYRLKLLAMSKDGTHRPVFPEQPLFRFIRRVYRCCQMGHQCGGVKGLQGREAAGSSVEFVLDEDVWSAPILRAEVHLQISNPHQLKVQPLLPWLDKRHLPTRFSVWWKDTMLEVRVDLLFLFQALQGTREASSVMEIHRLRSLHTLQTRHTAGRTERPLQVLALSELERERNRIGTRAGGGTVSGGGAGEEHREAVSSTSLDLYPQSQSSETHTSHLLTSSPGDIGPYIPTQMVSTAQ
ncbi:Hepatocyte nuclear factor 1-alpha [Bagarius yarrelli]|uniref:Hepatocyte nuclear factor 1-alpha n=1 Tax=Bagarius yarrelli TaxID=175774 RepID=A0A556VX06_BAGYA|nr:Hepatocyte nuclear factor 1-alpha [Bagarius yarrelli]